MLPLLSILTATDAGNVSIPVEPFLTLGTAVIAGILGLLGIWLKARLDRIDQTTAPTGNGFAARTDDRLDWLVNEFGGMRSDLRTLTNRFNDHIDTTQESE